MLLKDKPIIQERIRFMSHKTEAKRSMLSAEAASKTEAGERPGRKPALLQAPGLRFKNKNQAW